MYRPNIPDNVRKAVYWATLVVGFLSILVTGMATLWPAVAPAIAVVCSAALSAFGMLCASLAVVNVNAPQSGGEQEAVRAEYEMTNIHEEAGFAGN